MAMNLLAFARHRVWGRLIAWRAATTLFAALALNALLPPAVAGQTTTVEYYHLDALGSVRVVTNANGAVIARHDFLPFGEEWLPPSPAREQKLFTGQERDPETGLDYFGARYYGAQVGRFTTVDPGHIGGDIFDPQSWNGYAYARNNPLRYIDPMGTDYFVSVDGGQAFWASDAEFERLRGNPGAGISLLGGLVLAGGRIVGTYEYYSRFDGVLVDAGRRAAPGVNAALVLGVATTAIPAAAIGGGFLVGGGLAGAQPFLLPMGGGMAAAMNAVRNPALRRALDDIFRWQDRIAGGLAAAVRFTQQTGRLVGGSDHIGKLANIIGRLENILRREALSPIDRQLAEYVLKTLKELRP